VRIVVLLGKVREHQVARAAIEAFRIREEFADGVVREVAGAAQDALLDVPGIRPDLEHFEVVIGFENEAIGIAQMMFDESRQIAEVGDNGDFEAARAKREGHGIGGVVRNGKRRDLDVADEKTLARGNHLDAVHALAKRAGKKAPDFEMRRLGQIHRRAPHPQNLRQTVAMIGVLVGNQDAVKAVEFVFAGGEPRQGLAFAESGVNQEARVLGFEQRAVARASRRQNGDAQSDEDPPAVFRMMAKRGSAVNDKPKRGADSIFCGSSAGQNVASEGEAVQIAEYGDGDQVGAEKLAGDGQQFLAGDLFDGSEQLVERVETVEIHFLAGEIGHARAGGLERKHQRALEMVLGAAQLLFADRGFLEAAEFRRDHVHNPRGGLFGRAGVDREHAGVRIRAQLAEDGVGQAVLLADFLKQARRHAAAQDVVQHRGGEAALVRHGIRRNADADVHLLEVTFFFEANGRLGRRRVRSPGKAGGRQTAEFFFDEFDQARMFEIAGGGDDHIVRGVPGAITGEQSAAMETAHRFGSAENGPPQGMVGPEALRKQLVDQVLGVIQLHLDFFEDHLLFFAEVPVIKTRAQDKVGNNVEGDGEMLVEDFGVEADHFFGGEGVKHPADGINRARNVLGGAALGAFKDHMLDEVSDAVLIGSFAARAGADPNADRDGADVRHGLGNDDETVGENALLNVARLVGHGFTHCVTGRDESRLVDSRAWQEMRIPLKLGV